jgi:hypothetical protein
MIAGLTRSEAAACTAFFSLRLACRSNRFTLLYGRKLKLKAEFERALSYFSFKLWNQARSIWGKAWVKLGSSLGKAWAKLG